MRRILPASAVVVVFTVIGVGGVSAQPQILVNTTEWVFPVRADHCVAVESPCSIVAAIERGQSSFGATVSACFDQADPRCLKEDDPNFDPATGVWHLQIGDPFQPFIIDRDDMLMDFTANIDGWTDPSDNRIAIDVATMEQNNELFLISGNGNQFAGFELHDPVSVAHFVVRAVVGGAVASENVFGPGLVLSGLEEGVAIRMRGAGVTGNSVIGSWCGLRGDGTEVAGNSEHCVEIIEGANRNTVGGADPAHRNYFAGNLDIAVKVSDAASRDNVIEGNTIGLDVDGDPAGNATGIGIVREATGTKVFANIISGNEIDGILADRTSTEFGRIVTRIEDNYIGPGPSGDAGPGNGGCGILLRGLSKNVHMKNNRIWFNEGCGISIGSPNARDNTITQNSIARNEGRPILVSPGANESVQPPVIAVAEGTTVSGTACASCLVEVFSDALGEAEVFEGAVQADPDGTWTFEQAHGFGRRFITATATDGRNTSALSEAVRIVGGGRPTRTPTGDFGPQPTATRTPEVVLHSVRLPWTGQQAQR